MFEGYRAILASCGSILVLMGIISQTELDNLVEALLLIVAGLNGLAIVYKFIANKREAYLKKKLEEK